MGQAKKLQNLLFSILGFCSHDTTLEADPARMACAVDMLDGVSERLDVVLFERGIFRLTISILAGQK